MCTNRIIRNLLIFAFTVILTCSNCCLSALAETVITESQYNSYEFTIEDDFADDSVLVVFTQEASMQFKEYTPADFSEIGCKSVKGLATAKFNRGKQALYTVTDAVINGHRPIVDETLDLSNYNNIVSLKLEHPGKQNVLDAIKELKKRDDILFAEPNYTIHLLSGESTNTVATTENTELYYKTFLGLSDETNGKDARDLVDFENPITIGIIDTGIDTSREFCLSVRADSVNFTDYDAYDPVDNPTIPNNLFGSLDVRGHGTHVAGIISSTIDEAFFFGMENYAYVAEFLSVRAFDEDGEADLENIVCAINYLSEQEVPIINFSAGAYLPFQYAYEDSSLKNAIENFEGLFVCAAGNGDEYHRPVNLDTSSLFPAAWTDLENLITVGASDADDEIYSSSNYGKNTVDIFAPGENIYSCYPLNFCSENIETCPNASTHISYGYHSLSGTSMATGFVTGVAALVIQAYNENKAPLDPKIEPEDIKDIIMWSANKYRAAFEDKCVSNGRLDAYAAVLNAIGEICTHTDVTHTCTDSTHTMHCIICNYTADAESHEFYISSVNSSGTVVGCLGCDYTLNCDDQPSYISNGSTGHLVECSCACYSFIEKHDDFSCIGLLNDLYSHIVYCVDCGYSFYESHHWIRTGPSQLYICSDCGYTSDEDFVPGIMSLPDPELAAYLASLSEDELAEFIASLPEDQAARVTALLPSDDELLTE